MERIVHTIESEILQKEMNIAVYGHYGFAMLLFPSITDDYLENEENGIIPSISNYIAKGKCTVFSIGSCNFESWLHPTKTPEEKSIRHREYNNFIIQELLPFMFGICGGPIPIMACGAGLGGFHAANHYFRRPDVFYGLVAMSASYNIQHFSNNYFDENCYYNSPIHYLPNLTDEYWMSFLRSKHHVYLLSGTGENEHPQNLDHIIQILNMKNIPNHSYFWGQEWGHNPKTWAAMFNNLLDTKL